MEEGERFQVWEGHTIVVFKDGGSGQRTKECGHPTEAASGPQLIARKETEISFPQLQVLNSANNLYEQVKGSFPIASRKEYSPSNTFAAVWWDSHQMSNLQTCKPLYLQ